MSLLRKANFFITFHGVKIPKKFNFLPQNVNFTLKKLLKLANPATVKF